MLHSPCIPLLHTSPVPCRAVLLGNDRMQATDKYSSVVPVFGIHCLVTPLQPPDVGNQLCLVTPSNLVYLGLGHFRKPCVSQSVLWPLIRRAGNSLEIRCSATNEQACGGYGVSFAKQIVLHHTRGFTHCPCPSGRGWGSGKGRAW